MSIVADERATAIQTGARRRIRVNVYADAGTQEIKANYSGGQLNPNGDIYSGNVPPYYLLFLLHPDQQNGIDDVMFVSPATDAFIAKPGEACPTTPGDHDSSVFPTEYIKLNDTQTSLEAFNRNPTSQVFTYKLSILVRRKNSTVYEPKQLDPRIINR